MRLPITPHLRDHQPTLSKCTTTTNQTTTQRFDVESVPELVTTQRFVCLMVLHSVTSVGNMATIDWHATNYRCVPGASDPVISHLPGVLYLLYSTTHRCGTPENITKQSVCLIPND